MFTGFFRIRFFRRHRRPHHREPGQVLEGGHQVDDRLPFPLQGSGEEVHQDRARLAQGHEGRVRR